MSFVKELLKTRDNGQTVFVMADLAQRVGEYSGQKLRSALKYAVQRGDLVRVTRGIYALSQDYSRLELANKLRTPSYVSFYSILQQEGVVFQPYESIFLASKRSEEISLDEQNYIYRKIKDEILLNPMGIVNEGSWARATVERAICDKLYLDGDEYFDNLRGVDWEMMQKLNEEVYESSQVISKFVKEQKK